MDATCTPRQVAIEWLAAGRRVVAATLVERIGSAPLRSWPRAPGAAVTGCGGPVARFTHSTEAQGGRVRYRIVKQGGRMVMSADSIEVAAKFREGGR